MSEPVADSELEPGASADALRNDFIHMMGLLHRFRFVPPEFMRGLSAPEVRMLMMVLRADAHQEILRPSDVARAERITPSAVSQVVKTLERRGLVERVRPAGDSRAVNIVLTAEGRAFAQAVRDERAALLDEMVAFVGEDDMRHFVATLHKIIDFQERSASFEACDDAPVPPGGPCPRRGCPVRRGDGGSDDGRARGRRRPGRRCER